MSEQSPRKPRLRFTRKALIGGAALAAMTYASTAGASLTPEQVDAARNHAYSLNAQGRCVEAIPVWEELGRALSLAGDYLDAANCAMSTGDHVRAVTNLWEVVRRRDQLDTQQQVYALQSLGYQAEAIGDYDRALIGWDYAARVSDDSYDKLMAARAARMAGRQMNAQTRLMQLQADDFQGETLAMYYDEQSAVLRSSQPQAAAAYMRHAISIDDQAWRRFDHGLMLLETGDRRGAISEFRQALAMDPTDQDVPLSLAYALREEGENDEAAALFAEVIRHQPDNADLREDMGYALKDAGREDEAVTAFIGVIEAIERSGQAEAQAERLYRVRREVTELERDFTGFAYVTYRDEGVTLGNGIQQNNAYSSIGGEIAWRPDGLYENGRGISLFARGNAALEPGSFSLQEDTTQLGVGVRWKPFQEQNFTLSAERLIAAGDLARDDWLLRASYGWTNGYDWEPVRDNWNYTSLYADVAYIPGDDEYLGAYAQFRQGRRFKTGEGWAVTPYATVIAQYYDDQFGSDERVEAGVGVSVSRWFDQDDHHAYRRRVDFDVEYLHGVDGSNDSAIMGRVVFSF